MAGRLQVRANYHTPTYGIKKLSAAYSIEFREGCQLGGRQRQLGHGEAALELADRDAAVRVAVKVLHGLAESHPLSHHLMVGSWMQN